MEFAPAVASSSIPQAKPILQDLARLFLSLSGSRELGCGCGLCVFGCYRLRCWVVAWTRCTGAGSSPLRLFVCECPFRGWVLPQVVLPRPVRPVSRNVLGSPPALSGAAGARLAGRGPSWVRSVVGVGLLPLSALLIWLAPPPPLRPLL